MGRDEVGVVLICEFVVEEEGKRDEDKRLGEGVVEWVELGVERKEYELSVDEF